MTGQQPIIILKEGTRREKGKGAQIKQYNGSTSNIRRSKINT